MENNLVANIVYKLCINNPKVAFVVGFVIGYAPMSGMVKHFEPPFLAPECNR